MAHAQYPSGADNNILEGSTSSSGIMHQSNNRLSEAQSRQPTAQIKPSSPTETD